MATASVAMPLSSVKKKESMPDGAGMAPDVCLWNWVAIVCWGV